MSVVRRVWVGVIGWLLLSDGVSMNNLANRATVDRMSGVAIDLMLKSAAAAGIDVRAILGAAGLPLVDRSRGGGLLAGALSSGQLVLAFRVLMAALCANSRPEGAVDSPTKDDVDLFCSCLINCVTLDAVIERTVRFTAISNDRWGGVGVEKCGSNVVFFTDSRRQRNCADATALDIFCLVFFYKLFSWLIAEPLALMHLQLAHDRCIDSELAGAIVGCPLILGGERTALVFASKMLPKPVVQTYKALVVALESIPVALLAVPRAMSNRARVEMILRRGEDARAGIPKLTTVAAMLGQGVSTLRRNLLRENTSFQAIVDCYRMHRSMALLRETALTHEDISVMLGFSAPSVFSRAFKGWVGCSPSVYRSNAR